MLNALNKESNIVKRIFKFFALSAILATTINASAGTALRSSNVREKPSTNSSIVGWLKKGDKVEVRQRIMDANQRSWCKIDKGYVAASLLSLREESPPEKNKIVFLNGAQVKELLVEKTRKGIIRYTKEEILYESAFKKDGRVLTSIHSSNGTKIQDLPVAAWTIDEDGTYCVIRNNKKTNNSCKKMFNNGTHFASILTYDKKLWSRFVFIAK